MALSYFWPPLQPRVIFSKAYFKWGLICTGEQWQIDILEIINFLKFLDWSTLDSTVAIRFIAVLLCHPKTYSEAVSITSQGNNHHKPRGEFSGVCNSAEHQVGSSVSSSRYRWAALPASLWLELWSASCFIFLGAQAGGTESPRRKLFLWCTAKMQAGKLSDTDTLVSPACVESANLQGCHVAKPKVKGVGKPSLAQSPYVGGTASLPSEGSGHRRSIGPHPSVCPRDLALCYNSTLVQQRIFR